MVTVLFACTHNAGRSQMAAAFFNTLADPTKAVALSAGTQPAERVHPVVAAAMREIGIEVGNEQPKLLTNELARRADLVVTMGCGEQCPFVPGAEVHDWELLDPKDQPVEKVREVRDDIRRRVVALLTAKRLAKTGLDAVIGTD